MSGHRLELKAVTGLPLIEPGDDLAALIVERLRQDHSMESGDVLIVAQKVVSKAEGRYVRLAEVKPSPRAVALAEEVGRDARYVEVVLSESRRVIRHGPGVIIAEHRLGLVMANAGIDRSNIECGEDRVLLLPRDPDGSAAGLKSRLDDAFDVNVGVIINDSFGRPWRLGVTGVALGCAGLPALVSRVGTRDLFGRPLQNTQIAVADELAAAASLLMGQAAEGVPVVLARGLCWSGPCQPAAALLRPPAEDLFR